MAEDTTLSSRRSARTPQAERTERTRRRLLDAAQALFAARGYAATSTEEILAAAGVTRGALYHHFRDKADLFEALCVALHAEAAAAIEIATAGLEAEPLAAVAEGSAAWLAAVARPEVRRILCVDAPAVLGWQHWTGIDGAHGFALLREGVEAARGFLPPGLAPGMLAVMLNGAINALVLALPDPAGADDLAAAQRAIAQLIRSLGGNGGSLQVPVAERPE